MDIIPRKTYDEMLDYIDTQISMEHTEATARHILDEILDRLGVRVNQKRRQ